MPHLLSKEPLKLPPEDLLRAYLSLIHRVFVDLRSSKRLGVRQPDYVRDLANTMHNVDYLIARYNDGFLNDEKFRARLREFDVKWASEPTSSLQLEDELDQFAADYRDARSAPQSPI